MNGSLLIVGTPIGNLSDISPRAIENLQSADFIAAEDTRVTLKLLNHFGIKKEIISYFEHNKYEKGNIIIKRLENGETCVLVSDAGMPAISDPGEELVKKCIEKNIPTSIIPGPTALITGLVVSGLSSGRFTFEGFLSMNKKSRIEHLRSLKDEKRTMIFYEAPHKLKKTLSDMLLELGDRNIAIARELTKIHEEVIRTTIKSAYEKFSENKPKGEIVLIIEGNKTTPVKKVYSIDYAKKVSQNFIKEGLSTSEASKKASKITGHSKREIYKLLCEVENNHNM